MYIHCCFVEGCPKMVEVHDGSQENNLNQCKVVALDQLQLRLKSWTIVSFGITNIFGSKLPQ